MAAISLRAAAAVLIVFTQYIKAASLTVCSGQNCGGSAALEPEGEGEPKSVLLRDREALEFEAYAKKFDRKYDHDSKEYWRRRSLFEKRNLYVKNHNSKLNRLWEAVAGPFADFTEDERSAMQGYRSTHKSSLFGGAVFPTEVLRERELLRPLQNSATMPKEFDWLHLKVARMVPDQGQCGSCWAVTSKSVLDAHHEIYVTKNSGTPRMFSAQQAQLPPPSRPITFLSTVVVY